MDDSNEFGTFLRNRRMELAKGKKGFTLRKFAEAVELSPTYISKMERGEFPPPKAERIIKMAELLECNPDELLARAGKYDPLLSEIIKRNPAAVPDLLRTVQNISEDELRIITKEIKARMNK